jgi:hypothetical protein
LEQLVKNIAVSPDSERQKWKIAIPAFMLGIILGYLGRAHSNPTVVVNPSLVMMGTVNLKGMVEAVVMADLVAGSETDALTGDLIQLERCAKDTEIAMAMNDVE